MIHSMTGYGKAVCELPNKKISIEIKSLNSKQLDLNTRLPNLYREKDIEIRSLLSKQLKRGKIDLSFYVEAATSDKITKINNGVIKEYYANLKEVANDLNLDNSTDFLRVIMPLPDTVKVELAQLDEDEWKSIRETLSGAIDSINDFRQREGSALATDIRYRIDQIGNLLKEVDKYEGPRIDKIKSRIRESIE
ncbi:MAG: hypothetical protein JEZ14_25630, partial [Marinilabiliaceae bacterium]|nr:hypothetical protein [Marinilabiliaceae bacterium]